MDTRDHLEQISKLRQRLLRLIKLGQPSQSQSTTQINDDNHSNRTSLIDLTSNVEECVRRLFSTACSVESFVQDIQQILNVTIKSSLTLFLVETIPLAHQYLQQHQYQPYSWETFKIIALQSSTSTISSTPTSISSTRLPSLQQARFHLPPACPQLIDLTSSFTTPHIRPDANPYQQKLIHRFAQHNFHLNECGEHYFLQTLYTFLGYIIRRLLFFAQHRTDTHLLNSNTYDMTSNVREQIRFLADLNKVQNGQSNSHLGYSDQFPQQRLELSVRTDETRERRLSMMEERRQKEADETACFVLRESRLKRQKRLDNHQKITPLRTVRGSLQDLIVVMENETILRRSKTLLYAYANR